MYKRLHASFLTCLWMGATSAATAQWTREAIRSPPQLRRPSLALSAAREPIVAYGTDGIFVKTWNGTNWIEERPTLTSCETSLLAAASDGAGEPWLVFWDYWSGILASARKSAGIWIIDPIETVRTQVATADLAIGSRGPYVGYTDSLTGSLRSAHWNGTTWEVSIVAAPLLPDNYPTLAIDSLGYPGIAYEDQGLRYSRWDGVAWSDEPIAGASGLLKSLAFDRTNEPALAYSRTAELLIARRSAGSWVERTAATVTGGVDHPSLVFDRTGNPRIAYHDGTAQDLALARFDGTAWSSELIDTAGNTGLHPAFLLDDNDIGFIAYYAVEDASIHLATASGLVWQRVNVDRHRVTGMKPSLALDATGLPAVTYVEASPAVLRLARFDGTGWQDEVVDPNEGAGVFSSLAPDASGGLGIAYMGGLPAQSLEYAHWDGAVWLRETIVTSTPLHGSLAYDRSGVAIVAYLDAAEARLARRGASTWSTELIEVVSPFGGQISLALGRDDKPLVAYYDASTRDLKFARWTGSAWSIEVVDSMGDVGSSASLAIDAADHPGIAYFDVDNHALKYAQWTGSAWDLQVVDPNAYGDPYPSLAIDGSDRPRIAYFASLFPSTLRFASWNGSSWDLETVDGEGYTGWDPSLVLDGSGRPLIAYHAQCFGDLRLARHDGRAAATLFRKSVADLAPGWKAAALPLTDGNDDPITPFPIATTLGQSSGDTAPTSEPLVLYRLLRDGTTGAGNILRVVKSGGGLELRY